MRPLHIVITMPAQSKTSLRVDDSCLKMMHDAVPDAIITDASDLVLKELEGNTAAGRELDALLADTDILLGFAPPRDIVKRAPNLKWLQVTSAGVDRLANFDIWNSEVIITGVSGIHATAISEFVLSAMLMLSKNSLHAFRNQSKRIWERYDTALLAGRTLGIVQLP